jgi:hypothetical protein
VGGHGILLEAKYFAKTRKHFLASFNSASEAGKGQRRPECHLRTVSGGDTLDDTGLCDRPLPLEDSLFKTIVRMDIRFPPRYIVPPKDNTVQVCSCCNLQSWWDSKILDRIE